MDRTKHDKLSVVPGRAEREPGTHNHRITL